MNEEKFLKDIPFLRDLGEEDLQQILKIVCRVRFPAGKTILQEGEIGQTMYMVEEGEVEISKRLVMTPGLEERKNRDKILTKLSVQDHAVFGEVALFEEGKRTATVTAVTECVLLEIAKADFLKLAEENPRLGYRVTHNITRMLCARLRKADEDTIKLTTALSIALRR